MHENSELFENVWGEPLPQRKNDPLMRGPGPANGDPLPAVPSANGLEHQITLLAQAVIEIKSSLAVNSGQHLLLPNHGGRPSESAPNSYGDDLYAPVRVVAAISSEFSKLSAQMTIQMGVLQRQVDERLEEHQNLILKMLDSLDSAAKSLNRIASQQQR